MGKNKKNKSMGKTDLTNDNEDVKKDANLEGEIKEQETLSDDKAEDKEMLTDEGKKTALFIAQTQFNEQIFKDFSWANMFKGSLFIVVIIMAVLWLGLGIFKLAADKDIIFGTITLVVALVCLPLIVVLGSKRMAKNLYKNYLKHTGGHDQKVTTAFFEDYFALLNNNTRSFSKQQYESVSRVFTFKNLILIGTKSRKFFMMYKTDLVKGTSEELIAFLKEHIAVNRKNKFK